MAGQRQPLELVLAKGAKHLTKDEIKERREREVKPITDNIIAPAYLTKKQTAEFDQIAEQLKKLKIMGETDCDALARYIIAKDMYIAISKKMRSKEVLADPFMLDQYSKLHERFFKQCRSSANDLALSITSRCKLVIPQIEKEAPKENKFKIFEKGRVSDA